MPRKNSSNWNVADPVTAARLNDFNEDIDDLYLLGNDRGRIVQSTLGALKIDIGAFAYRVGAQIGLKTAQSGLSVTDNATNYVEIDDTGTIQISTSTWTSNRARIGTVVAASGVITSINIYKPDVVGGDLGGAVIAYNTKTAKTLDVVYQASNKGGFLVAFETGGTLATNHSLYSDASNPPTTYVGGCQANDNTEVREHSATPIMPNHYYKVSGQADTNIWFFENV